MTCHNVAQWRTLDDVTQTAREPLAVRLSANGLAAVKKLAAEETEGNVSMMIRKLLGEALAARQKRGHK